MEQIKDIAPYQDDRGNRIIGTAKLQSDASVIYFHGSNCTLEIDEDVVFQGVIQFHQDDGHFKIGRNSMFRGGAEIGAGGRVTIGQRLNITNLLTVVVADGAEVSIGDDCLFASGVNLRAFDNHPIYDLRTGKRTNFSRSISIGNRVWMGYQSAALGGANVGDGSIVGFRSVVTAGRPIPPHCLAVGSPAKVVKKYIAWSKDGNPPSPTLANRESYPAIEDLPYHSDMATPRATAIRGTVLAMAQSMLTINQKLVNKLESK